MKNAIFRLPYNFSGQPPLPLNIKREAVGQDGGMSYCHYYASIRHHKLITIAQLSTLAFLGLLEEKRENLILTVTHLPLTASLLQFDRDQGRVFNRQDQGHFRQTLIQDSLTRKRITQCIWLFLLSMFSSKVEQPQSCFMHQT